MNKKLTSDAEAAWTHRRSCYCLLLVGHTVRLRDA
jgi:hypothetical protein